MGATEQVLTTVEIMDTTLRDGEQTSGVSFTAQEKLTIAKLLLDKLKVNRIEVASARVSEGEFEAVSQIARWAKQKGYLGCVEVLGFIDGSNSIDWIYRTGCRVMNLLSKGSLKHLEFQLRKTPEQHVRDIQLCVENAVSKGIAVNLYLEDWSNGMLHSREYVYYLLESLSDLPIQRFMLPDTLGILNPFQVSDFCKEIVKRFPRLRFDFHAHNDYDLATANVLASVEAGIRGVHTTINGLGERAGNAPLSSVLAVLHDQLNMKTTVQENQIYSVSRMVETYSGIRIAANKPVIGNHVFTQCAGIHADGDNKNNLYYNDLLPERFGRTREYALGKTSGKANILKNLENLGIVVDDEIMRRVTERIVELGDKKEIVTQEDLPYIIADLLNEVQTQKVKVKNYILSSAKGMHPVVVLKLDIEGVLYEETAAGDGMYDAFMNALHKIYQLLERELPLLTDYSVAIPPGGRTDAFVQTLITWNFNGKEFRTHGLDADQTEAAIKATVKMLNRIEELREPKDIG